MPTARVEVDDSHDNWVNWGKLVKTWATGNNYFNDGHNYTIPDSLDSFTAQLAQAKVTMAIPQWVQAVQFIQGDGKTLVVRLPPRDMIEDSEARLRALVGGDTSAIDWAEYPLPSFYQNEAWGVQPQNKFGIDQLLAFHCERIGEYTINNCL